jgi:hypothetical protein
VKQKIEKTHKQKKTIKAKQTTKQRRWDIDETTEEADCPECPALGPWRHALVRPSLPKFKHIKG